MAGGLRGDKYGRGVGDLKEPLLKDGEQADEEEVDEPKASKSKGKGKGKTGAKERDADDLAATGGR